MRAMTLLALLVVAVATSCSGDEATVTPTTPAMVSLPTRETKTPSPPPTFPAVVDALNTVWLIEVEDTELHVLFEHPRLLPEATWVAPRAARVSSPSSSGVFDGAGRAISFPSPRCAAASEGVSVGGVAYPGIPRCGPVSPDGRYMLFDIPLEPASYPPLAERWLLDIENGAPTLLEAQVVDCGGCDSRYGAQWSPDGRFVLFAESGGTGRVFLVDLQGRTTTVVGNGNDLFLRPAWSPDLDQPQFLLPADNATRAVLVDAETGERLQLPIGWPAAFGARGRFAYSFPAHVPDDQQPTTFIVDLITMEVVEVAGAPPLSYAFEGDVAVASGDEGFVAVVEGDACRGTMLHVEDELPRCLDGARGAVPSPDGRRVAFSREVEGRGRSAVGTALRRYDLFVLDVDTGNERVLAPGAYSAALPPRLQWSRFGDLVLVSWPHFTGL